MQTNACLNLNNQTKAINFYRNSAMLSWRRGLAGLSGVIADPKQASQGLPTGWSSAVLQELLNSPTQLS